MLALGLAGAFILFFPTGDHGDYRLRVEKGDSFSTISKKLEEGGVIRSAPLFKVFAHILGTNFAFYPGSYDIPTGRNFVEIQNILDNLHPLQIRVTIPEGLTATKIATLLDEKKITGKDDFLNAVHSPEIIQHWKIPATSLDGFLFPDTYYFAPDTQAVEVVEKMVSTFFDRVRSLSLKINDPKSYDDIILASIVEREYRVDAEAPLIASVFLNRLHRHIPLASCATIEYILTEIQGKPHPQRIYFANTQIVSEFNTYLKRGLPPKPICNPGLTALKAIFFPVKTDYLFFVVENATTGSHKFSNSFAEHEKAREDYINSYIVKN